MITYHFVAFLTKFPKARQFRLLSSVERGKAFFSCFNVALHIVNAAWWPWLLLDNITICHFCFFPSTSYPPQFCNQSISLLTEFFKDLQARGQHQTIQNNTLNISTLFLRVLGFAPDLPPSSARK